MGYDMHWRKVDDDERVACAAAREVWNQALAVRDALPDDEKGHLNMARAKESHDFDAHENYDGRTDRYRRAQDAVMDASRGMDEARQSYFRLNMFGMSRFADVMYELGMAFDDEPHPDWPETEAYGVTWDDVERIREADGYYKDEPPLPAEQQEKVGRFVAEHDRILAWHGMTDTPGIPVHKFSSNDGWIVLPAECKAALAIYMARMEEIGQDAMDNLIDNKIGSRGRWAQWLYYLRGAITHEGFEVD